VTKKELLAEIQKCKRRSCRSRKAGRISRASADENYIDTLILIAKAEGYGQEAEDAELEATS
jgi:hypothetical protein